MKILQNKIAKSVLVYVLFCNIIFIYSTNLIDDMQGLKIINSIHTNFYTNNTVQYELSAGGELPKDLSNIKIRVFCNLSFFQNGIIINNNTNQISQKVELSETVQNSTGLFSKFNLYYGLNNEIEPFYTTSYYNILNLLLWKIRSQEEWLNFTLQRNKSINESAFIKTYYDPIHSEYTEIHGYNNLVEKVSVDTKRGITVSSIIVPSDESRPGYFNEGYIEDLKFIEVRLIESASTNNNNNSSDVDLELLLSIVGISILSIVSLSFLFFFSRRWLIKS